MRRLRAADIGAALVALGVVLVVGTAAAPVAEAADRWSEPQLLSGPGVGMSAPDTAMNASGDAVVAWHRHIDSYNSVVQVSLRRRGGPFGPARVLSDLPPVPADRIGHAFDPSVAMAADGTAYAVWDQVSTGVTRVAVAPPGREFGTPFTLVGLPRRVRVADVRTDSAGRATIFAQGRRYPDDSPGPDTVEVVRLDRDGSTVDSQTVVLPQADPLLQEPHYLLTPDGDIAIAWWSYLGAYAVVRRGDGVFGPIQRLRAWDRDYSGPRRMFVRGDAAGNVTVAWNEPRPEDPWAYDLRLATVPAGRTTFPAPERLRTRGDQAVEVAVARDGEATALYVGDPHGGNLMATTRRPGGRFGPLELVSPEGGPPHEAYSAAYDDAGSLYVAWRRDGADSDGIPPDDSSLWVARRLGGGAFTAAIVRAGANTWAPSLAAAGAGALVAWPQVETRWGGAFDLKLWAAFVPDDVATLVADPPPAPEPPTVADLPPISIGPPPGKGEQAPTPASGTATKGAVAITAPRLHSFRVVRRVMPRSVDIRLVASGRGTLRISIQRVLIGWRAPGGPCVSVRRSKVAARCSRLVRVSSLTRSLRQGATNVRLSVPGPGHYRLAATLTNATHPRAPTKTTRVHIPATRRE